MDAAPLNQKNCSRPVDRVWRNGSSDHKRTGRRFNKVETGNSGGQAWKQRRPVNVKHDARCVMGKVGGKTKDPKRGEFSFIVIQVLHNSCVTIKCPQTHIQPFVLFVICYYLVVTGHCCESMTQTHGSWSSDL